MFLNRLRAMLQPVQIELNERGSSGSYDLQRGRFKVLTDG